MKRLNSVPIGIFVSSMLVAALAGALAVCWLTSFVQSPIWCGSQPADAICAREWVSATSGWAAAIVAGISLGYLAKQVRSINIPVAQMRVTDLANEQSEILDMIVILNPDKSDSLFNQIAKSIKYRRSAAADETTLNGLKQDIQTIRDQYTQCHRRVSACLSYAEGNNTELLQQRMLAMGALWDILANLGKIERAANITNFIPGDTIPSDFLESELREAKRHAFEIVDRFGTWYANVAVQLQSLRKELAGFG